MKKIIADGKAIRKRMIDKDIKTIGELSAKSGVSKPTIYDYLNGKSPLSATFTRLCEYLELEPGGILLEQDAESLEE